VSPDRSARVRRLIAYLERSVAENLQFAVFEPNDEPLWASARRSVANLLDTTWRNGLLEGNKPEDAYFVRCDRTTMTQDDLGNGLLVCLVGVAPQAPAEFEIFRISQVTGDAPQG
jgi:phage tail sheath protein FI